MHKDDMKALGITDSFKNHEGNVVLVAAEPGGMTRISAWDKDSPADGFTIMFNQKEAARFVRAFINRMAGDMK